MAEKSYAKMTMEELLDKNQELMAKRDAIRLEQKEIAKTLDLRAAEQKFSEMTEAEQESLKQVIGLK